MQIGQLPAAMREEWQSNLQRHIECVQKAGFRLGVPDKQLRDHDLSKWSEEEFPGYALKFLGNDDSLFAAAWHHHFRNNPHHWQYWMFPDEFKMTGTENGCLPMPMNYALEMVADWCGASVVYTGLEDMSDWLARNWRKVRMHSETREYVREVLDSLGYADIVNLGM